MATSYGDSVPTWDGDASQFESFVTACRWYEKGLKDSEKPQAASRVWQRMTGAAKAVVQHLNPDEFSGTDSLSKLLDVLRSSPLQQLPVPDSFARLEAWHGLKRKESESIPELIVREQLLFTELQQSLQRAREDRQRTGLGFLHRVPSTSQQPTHQQQDPPSTPSRSPLHRDRRTTEDAGAEQEPARPAVPPAPPAIGDYFEDEMRGYRLLKASRLNREEKQHVLTQTGNTTHFNAIRVALRTLFAEDELPRRDRKSRIWWNDFGNEYDENEEWDAFYGQDHWEDQWYEPNYWNDEWNEWDSYDDWYGTQEINALDESSGDVLPDESQDGAEEAQYREAFALAAEANKTMREAKEAVRRTRIARGYYAPESSSGKGIVGMGSKSGGSPSHKGKGSGSSSSHSGKGRTMGFGPCFICGKDTHGYRQCPDRFSKGFSKGGKKGFKGKGKFGKSKFKGKGTAHFVDIHLNVLAAQWDDSAVHGRAPTRAIIDTGATENAIGINSLHDLVVTGGFAYDVCQDNLPTFRFGNGHSDSAKSRVDIHGTSLGSISFYVLDGMASSTPPLIGSRTLRSKQVLVSYLNGMFIFRNNSWKQDEVMAIQMQALQSGHLTIDFSERPSPVTIDIPRLKGNEWNRTDPMVMKIEGISEDHGKCSDWTEGNQTQRMVHIYMLRKEPDFVSSKGCDLRDRLQSLAQRLHQVQRRHPAHQHVVDSSSPRRSSSNRIPMLQEACGRKSEEQSAWDMADLPEMCSSPQLSHQERHGWRVPPNGATSSLGHIGPGVSGEGDGCSPSGREDLQWKADGVEGQDVATRIDPDYGGQSDPGGVSSPTLPGEQGRSNCGGRGPSSQGEGQEREVQGQDSRSNPEVLGCNSAGYHLGTVPEVSSNGVRGTQWSNSGSTQADCQAEGEVRAQVSRSHGGCRRDGGCDGLGGGEDRGPLKALWSALSGLQQKMHGPIADHTTQHDTTNSLKDVVGMEVVTVSRSAVSGGCNQCTTMSPHGDLFPSGDQILTVSQDRMKDLSDAQYQSNRNVVGSQSSRKISMAMAAVGMMVIGPISGLMGQLAGVPDFVEVACSQTSSLSTEMERLGYNIKRYNYISGYDLEKKSGTRMLLRDVQERTPRSMWVSLPCTRISALQNLTERTDEEWAKFEKRQQQDLQRGSEVADSVVVMIEQKQTFAWEWPTTAKKGWSSKAIRKILRALQANGQTAYWCRFDGCAYGLVYGGLPVRKGWTVLTNSRFLWLSLQKRCPGHTDHAECRGAVAQASSYYPWPMVSAVTKALIKGWQHQEDNNNISLSRDVETYLLEIPVRDGETCVDRLREEEPEIMALTRSRFPEEPPTGKRLEAIRQQMMRIHRASGHASFTNLQRLLRMRNAPKWSIEMAGKMTCPDCVEARKPPPHPVASIGTTPGLYEILGTDVFEMEHGGRKHKFLLWRDRASGLAAVDHLQSYGGPDDEVKFWEPTTGDVLRSFSRWLQNNPPPVWVISDPATYYTSEELTTYMGRAGIGVLTTPAEAHHMMGAEEGCINVLKSSVNRLLKEHSGIDLVELFNLAVHGHNNTIGVSGFSPFQWTRGAAHPQGQFPMGIDPSKAFAGQLKMREKARMAYEAENAKYRLSKLNNSVTRPPQTFKPGSLAMLWRQRVRPGRTTGQWVGPVRVLVQEGATVWTATGSSIIKARTTQLRACTKREEMQSMLEGTAIYRVPVTLETLLQSFTGRHFMNVTGEAPSDLQQQQDVTGAEVTLPAPSSGGRLDTWKVEQEGQERWLVRIHNAPRLTLFSPEKVATIPVDVGELTGKRISLIKPIAQGSTMTRLEDDFRESDDPIRSLQERWTGQTRLEIKPKGRPPKTQRLSSPRGTKRSAEKDVEQESNMEDGEKVSARAQSSAPLQQEEEPAPLQDLSTGGTILPEVSEINPLNSALHERGPDVVDGVPGIQHDSSQAIGNLCAVRECVLPGGHHGAHEDSSGKKFSWTPFSGRVALEEDSSSDDSGAGSDTSEELVEDQPSPTSRPLTSQKRKKEDDFFLMMEIEVSPEDAQYLKAHPRKASIWLSKKMEMKSKEHSWTRMSMKEKESFDLAEAKELSNVLQSKALRTLTEQEFRDLDKKRLMNMRWVLTTKADGTSKARLVILGFQQWNLVDVQASAPTLSRLSRNTLLAVCANQKFALRSGDVTSAFLQTEQSLENEELYVWPPPEVAVLFGADPNSPSLPLKVVKAFYGLAHAPRKWYEQVCTTLQQQGWRRLLSDGCVFVLMDQENLVGICGLHVDDFLIGGMETNKVYAKARQDLEAAFRWGKWDDTKFTFAGCQIEQLADMSIKISQEEYTEKWFEEIELTSQRMKEMKSLATADEVSKLRGVIGTVAWRASQSAPHYQADAGLLLSEVPHATVDTLIRANKLVREMQRESNQCLLFPSWGVHWSKMTTVVWADASQKNRYDGSSTMGLIAAVAPRSVLDGEETQLAFVHWRSSKTPRQCLGSNGAEVQAITEGEDLVFRIRGLWAEMHGVVLERQHLYEQIRSSTTGALVMDSRGIYDAITRNTSSLHGLRSGRAGYELALAICQARRIDTVMRWVNGVAQLADAMTKSNSRRVLLQCFSGNQRWRLIHDEKFTAGKKLKKRELLKKLQESEVSFVGQVRKLAAENRWPWDEPVDLRNKGHESFMPTWFNS